MKTVKKWLSDRKNKYRFIDLDGYFWRIAYEDLSVQPAKFDSMDIFHYTLIAENEMGGEEEMSKIGQYVVDGGPDMMLLHVFGMSRI